MRYIYLFEILSIMTVGLFSTGCGKQSANEDDGRLTIAVSIPPQEALLGAIAGDSVNVVTLLRADSNPESFEPSVTDMKNIHSADAYFSIGHLPFEQTLVGKIRATIPNLKYYDNSTGIELIYGTHGHHHGEHHVDHHHDGDQHEAADPHIWSSIANLKTIGANMLEALNELDHANSDYYTYNYNRLVERLDSIDAVYHNRLDGVNRNFLVWHPSLSYFARDYGLNQIAVGQENKEMSVKQFKEKIDRAAESGVRAFFVQKNMDATQTESLVRQIGVNVVEINPLDCDWENQLNIVVDAIAN